MHLIKLTGAKAEGRYTIVDSDTFEWLNTFPWYYDFQTGYAKTKLPEVDGKQTCIKLHRLLMPRKPGFVTDHINRNKLDNRRVNLRYVSKGENNRNAFRKDNKSGFTGVTPLGNRWLAKFKYNGFYHSLGSFKTKDEAARAYASALNDPSQLKGIRVPRWSEAELEILKRYKELGLTKVAELIGRSKASIATQARRKGYSQ